MPRPIDFLPIDPQTRPRILLNFEFIRDLTHDDLIQLQDTTNSPTRAVQPLKVIRAIHRKTAMLVAAGFSDVDIAIMVGRTPASINSWRNSDPAFRELVEGFQKQIENSTLDVAEALRNEALDVAQLAWMELRERLEDDEKRAKISTSEIRQIAQLAGDRTHLPPKTAVPPAATPTNITFNIPGPGIKVIDHED
jgi:hypothetical protein